MPYNLSDMLETETLTLKDDEQVIPVNLEVNNVNDNNDDIINDFGRVDEVLICDDNEVHVEFVPVNENMANDDVSSKIKVCLEVK